MLALLLAAALDTATVEHAVRLVMRTQHVAALSLGIERSGREIFEGAYGTADFGRGTPASAQTVYRIGSLTKPFTARAIEILSAQRRVELDDPVAGYAALPWNAPITIRELLEQRSGIPSYSDDPSLDMHAEYTPAQLVNALAAEPLDFPPGTQFEYSNTNYILLGAVIERASGVDYGSYLRQAILMPMQLHSTRYGDARNEARGYATDTLHLPIAPSSLSYAYAAAGMSSNVPDLLRFLQSAAEPYYGFLRADMNGTPIVYASGFVPGYSAFEMIVPQTRDTIVILTNADKTDLIPLAQDLLAALEAPAR